ncbi:GNAT family N-acetyltransferase [Streptomyces chartreusis]|uniref:GNAT family N-acetyltransferase n=1 Tax=Streptomyces chartreusis TaxID=1969 RepID=UPI002E179330|nr:GNAT family N-acetyltransferase [Streptomyces chartreusis]
MTAATVDLRHFGHDDLSQIRQTLLDVHADAYADDMTEFDERFPWFVDHWGSNPGFACVIGYEDGEPVGFAYGAPAKEGREWWREHLSEPPADTSTFAISELMVRPKWRKTGTAERLHIALLEGRTEAQAVLLVDPDHPKVQALYVDWGYREVGHRQPFPDSPNYAVMLRDLR